VSQVDRRIHASKLLLFKLSDHRRGNDCEVIEMQVITISEVPSREVDSPLQGMS